MPTKIVRKPAPQVNAKPAVKTPKKPKCEGRDKGSILCKRELDAHYHKIGLMALEDIRCIWLALNALTVILLFQGDERQEEIGNLMRLPVRRLGVIVKKEFPDLDAARKRLVEANAQTRAFFDKGKKGGAR
jgi:hypothetical protein